MVLLKAKQTNSSKTTFEESLLKFKQRLRARGYPKTIIRRSLSGVNFASRPSALTRKKSKAAVSQLMDEEHYNTLSLKQLYFL